MTARTRTRFLRVAATALAAALVLTGCQAIPSDGPVHEGLHDLSIGEQPVLYNPSGPTAGASQREIVLGFISAATSSADDYATARQFLAPDYAADWDPGYGVYIDSGDRPYQMKDDETGIVSLSLAATVDERGVLQAARPGPTTDLPFELRMVEGEWRIASAPAGLILDRSTFLTIWSPRQLFFLSPDNRLVPETRWFLDRAALPTQIVSELLSGPSEMMTETLRSAVPAGTTLHTSSVPIVSGRAQVDLAPEILRTDESTLTLMVKQIAASLQSIPGITGFDLFAGGAPVETSTVGWTEEPSVSAEHAYAIAKRDDAFGALVSGEIEEIPGLSPAVEQMSPLAVSVSVNRDEAAVLTRDGTYRVSESGAAVIDPRSRQLQPSLDRFGYAWTISTEQPDRVLVSDPLGGAMNLSLPWLAGRTPAAARVSPGGARIAVLVEEGEQSVVLVAGVIRDSSGAPVAVSDAGAPALWMAGTPIDLDWVDDVKLAALSRGSGGSNQITMGGAGLLPTDSGSVAQAIQISGNGRPSLVRVLDRDGNVYAPQGSSGAWQRQQGEIDLLGKTG